MKRLFVGWVAAIFLAGTAAQAGDKTGAFFTADAGANIMTDFDIGNGSHLEMDLGSRLDGSIGYAFFANEAMSISGAFETGIMGNAMDRRVNASGTSSLIEGDVWQSPVLGRIGIRFCPESKLSPFLSVAGGGVYLSWEVRRVGGRGGFTTGDEWDPAGQASAGLKYRFAEKMSAGLGYKLLVAFPDGYRDVVNHSIVGVFSMEF